MNTLVCISKARRMFKKGYLPNWTEDIFTIKSRENRTNPPYKIVDFKGKPIKGNFYDQELQKVENPAEIPIESTLQRKQKGRDTLYLFKGRFG